MPKRIVSGTRPTLYPVPVALVTCGTAARPNIITIAFAGIVCGDPPTLSVAVRPSRYSNELIRSSGEFVVNIPTVAMLDKTEFCGAHSGRQVDKFNGCQFTPEEASVVSVPLIAECPVNVECVVTQVLPLGLHDLFLGRIVSVHVDEAVLDENGELDVSRAQPIAYVMHKFYGLSTRLVPGQL